MAKFTSNHDRLYFDALCRTKKGESVLSLIVATYQVKGKGKGEAKEQIAKKLEYAYELYKGDSGSYSGDVKQFTSQYTIGHELCIWKNSDLDLTDLAIEVAENRITIRDYFDIVFLNYIQPVNNKIVHFLYQILVYMRDHKLTVISKDEMPKAYGDAMRDDDRETINGAYNMLISSNYFKTDTSGKNLVFCAKESIDELISCCNLTYFEKGYEVAKIELQKEEDYIAYLLTDHRKVKMPQQDMMVSVDDNTQLLVEYSSADLEARREVFISWFKHLVKPLGKPYGGQPYSDSVIKNYADSLEFDTSKLEDISVENTNLYFYEQIDAFDQVVTQIKQAPNYEDINKKRINKGYTCALDKYREFLLYLHGEKIQNEKLDCEVVFETGYTSEFGRNRIIFGAPGTGKSYTLNDEREKLLVGDCELNYERVTFHPDYAYANFVGTYKPTMVKTDDVYINLDEDKRRVLAVLHNKNMSAQEKYDCLYDQFKEEGLTRLPLLLGIYTDENFKTRKMDGTDAVGDNSVERNHGRAVRPYVNIDDVGNKEIAYEYVPGPFMRVLVKALKSAMTDNPKPYLLIIEEINRANVAAVFGDIFQLLDRNEKNISEYAIATSNDMRAYLAEELEVDESKVATIKIPDNMFIWATMNSADQGVFPMDTAFKRRWDFDYLGIDDAVVDFSEKIKNKKYVIGQGEYARLVSWNSLRNALNEIMSSESFNINEDKLLGPYFISKTVLEDESDIRFVSVFKNKVLMYLFDDAVKQKRKSFFEECSSDGKGIRYSEICKLFDKKGVFIFPTEVSERFNEKPDGMQEEEN